MAGPEKGLASLFQEDYSHIADFNDLSHIYNLICKHAITAFPEHILSGIKNINSTFRKSPQKSAILKRIQLSRGRSLFLQVIKYTPVRWLSLVESIGRIIEIWNDLKIYYNQFGETEEKNFFSISNEACLKTFFILLDQITYYNKLFQNSDMTYDVVIDSLHDSFRVFWKFITKEEQQEDALSAALSFDWEEDSGNEDIMLSENEFYDFWTQKYSSINDLLKTQEIYVMFGKCQQRREPLWAIKLKSDF